MKAELMLENGIAESNIHIAKTIPEVEQAMAEMKAFGESHAFEKPAALIFYAGHNSVDNICDTYTDPDRRVFRFTKDEQTKPELEGSFRGTLELAHPDFPDNKNRSQFLHEYRFKDMLGKYFQGFSGRTLFILETCYAASWIAHKAKSGRFNVYG